MSTPARALARVAGLAGMAAAGAGVALAAAVGLELVSGSTTTVTVERTEAPAGGAREIVVADGGLRVERIYERAERGVVQVSSVDASSLGSAKGSGFVLDKAGHVVTSLRVVEGADVVRVSFSNRDGMAAELVGVDPPTGLAVLRVAAPARALAPLPLGDSEAVRVGDPVVAIGNARGLERSVADGIVAALRREVGAAAEAVEHVIQTDAAIDPGGAGGPLLDALGRVIGVVTEAGLAVPVDTVKDVVAQLIETGRVTRASLGARVQAVDPAVARAFRLPVHAGVLVRSVDPGGAADRAGIRGGTTDVVVSGESLVLGGDLLVSVAGRPVREAADVSAAVAAHEPGDRVAVVLYRGGERLRVQAVLR